METKRNLTDKERESLYKEVRINGKFIFKGNKIDCIDIAALQLFPANCLLNEDDNQVSFKGECQFTEHEERGDLTCPAKFSGSAEMSGLNEFILSQNPILITK